MTERGRPFLSFLPPLFCPFCRLFRPSRRLPPLVIPASFKRESIFTGKKERTLDARLKPSGMTERSRPLRSFPPIPFRSCPPLSLSCLLPPSVIPASFKRESIFTGKRERTLDARLKPSGMTERSRPLRSFPPSPFRSCPPLSRSCPPSLPLSFPPVSSGNPSSQGKEKGPWMPD